MRLTLQAKSLNWPLSHTEQIGIIGGGLSGSLVALQVMRQVLEDPSMKPIGIRLFEERENFHQGLAYSTSEDFHLLNLPARKMSIWPDKPLHFVEWLRRKSYCQSADAFVPRRVFAEYLADEFLFWETKYGHTLKTHLSVSKLQRSGNGFTVVGNTHSEVRGEYPEFDNVVIATGQFRQQSLSMKSRLDDSGEGPKMILLIGTGLTMIDNLFSLLADQPDASVIAISRHGLLPLPHQSEAVTPVALNLETQFSLTSLFRELHQQGKKKGSSWREVIDGLRPQTQRIWQGLSLPDKERFFRHAKVWWEIHKNRLPPQQHLHLQNLIKTGQLQIMAGRIAKLAINNLGRIECRIQKRADSENIFFLFDEVIDCRGPGVSLDPSTNSLLAQLIDEGEIQLDELSMGLVASESGQLLGKSGRPSKGLWTLGPLLRGSLWETFAVPEIATQAESLAMTLVGARPKS